MPDEPLSYTDAMNTDRPAPSDMNAPAPRKQKRQRRPKPPAPPRRPEETIDSAWRLFIAVPLAPDVVTFVDRTIRSLGKENWPVKWTPPGNAHLTLHFLGDVAPERADLLRLALREPIAQHQRFDLRTADLGAFPTIRRPKVLWLGLYGPTHRLDSLRESIGNTLVELEYELEDRAFTPHITLGRVRPAPPAQQRDLPQRIRARFERAAETGEVSSKMPVPFPIDEVLLIRSHLSAAGARYEVLETYPLHQAEPRS
ncbi:MAG TPA: RNA 2',3'-cyclic phosphodiesterase [Thermomicrobiales bacterium]|nr:RNA 2',3'-cyclic phosphodiesterase [Thermomicrobiales bacterium]